MSFNIRVYGILIRNQAQVLVTDEYLNSLSFTKFPGGGLEFGEGLKDCVIREFLEELNLPIKVVDLFYLTEHFQRCAFNKNDQILSIYYRVEASEEDLHKLLNKDSEIGKERPKWIALKELNPDLFRFPIDKKVVLKLQEHFA